jgi:CRP-like cAMP-binding protein
MNRILSVLPESILSISKLEQVTVAAGHTITPRDYVYFPASGAITLTAPDLNLIGAVIGDEGAFNALNAFEPDIGDDIAVCHVETKLTAIPSGIVTELVDQLPDFRAAVVAAHTTACREVKQTLLCNTCHPAAERLARWLSRFSDCYDGPLPLTQQQLAEMLGLSRPSVAQLYGSLSGLISVTRGQIKILDKVGLQGRACRCYVRETLASQLSPPTVPALTC